MTDQANVAGCSKRTLAVTPRSRASASASQLLSEGCGTTTRSGANGSPGSARMRRASSAASVSTRFEEYSRTGSYFSAADNAGRAPPRAGCVLNRKCAGAGGQATSSGIKVCVPHCRQAGVRRECRQTE